MNTNNLPIRVVRYAVVILLLGGCNKPAPLAPIPEGPQPQIQQHQPQPGEPQPHPGEPEPIPGQPQPQSGEIQPQLPPGSNTSPGGSQPLPQPTSSTAPPEGEQSPPKSESTSTPTKQTKTFDFVDIVITGTQVIYSKTENRWYSRVQLANYGTSGYQDSYTVNCTGNLLGPTAILTTFSVERTMIYNTFGFTLDAGGENDLFMGYVVLEDAIMSGNITCTVKVSDDVSDNNTYSCHISMCSKNDECVCN